MRKSIRLQFYSFIVVLLTVLFLLLNIYPMRSSRDAVFEEKKSSLSNQGAAIASTLSRLDYITTDGIREVLQLLDITGFSRIVVTDSEGNPIYDSTPGDMDAGEREDISAALTGKTVFRSSFANSVFNSRYSTPIEKKSTYIGALYLQELDGNRAEILLGIQSRIRVITAIVSVSTIILAVIFSGTLLRRISDLSSSMRVVAEGNYAYRMNIRGKDELAELGNEFNQLTERLQETDIQRRRFVSDASHELKTPLASIRLLSDSIIQSDNMDEDTMREFVSDIGGEAERLQRTTEKLLDLSRMDDDVRVVPEPVDMKQSAIDALALLKPLSAEKNVHIRCELEEGCVVMATADDMFHIIFNLMENAVKYNVPGGMVDVILSGTEDEIFFTVKDTGIGIPEEDRFNIFNRFYRVDKARSREAGGSGLGLSIVHDAVKMHGGNITVGANKPQGSIFTLSFPRPSSEETGI